VVAELVVGEVVVVGAAVVVGVGAEVVVVDVAWVCKSRPVPIT